MNAPREPEVSCPYLDSAINEIENARKIHEKLREWGTWWMERCEELEKEHALEIAEMQQEIDRLQGKGV